MPLVIRPSRESDIPAITEIYAHAVLHGTASFELEPPDEAEMARRRETLLATGFPYLVAEEDGAVRGYAYAGQYRPRPAYRFTVEDSIYLDPGFHGRGIGRALLVELIAICTSLGYRQMIAGVGDSMNLGSIGVHRSVGFEIAGTMANVGFKHGRWLDQVLMQRALGDGAATAPA